MSYSAQSTTAALLVLLALALAKPHGEPQKAPPPEQLDKLMAAVALYPDSLLAQILLCATKPGEVVALNGWLGTNTTLKGSDLQDAASQAGFEPSFVALVLFPSTVKMMAEQIDWTTRVGHAFTASRADVFASIQRLRSKAHQTGNLKTTEQQEVETRTTSSGQQVIVIEPANPQIVYVPQYNPQVVYTQPATTTVVVEKSTSSADAAAAGVIGFAAGIAIGAAIDNDYYYGPYGWRGGAYMYNDAWDDYYDAREDAREDWHDQRQDMAEERTDRAQNQQEQRTERQGNRQENRPATQAQGQQSQQSRAASQEARGYTQKAEGSAKTTRTGKSSDAFSGYSSGKSERAASTRGASSRSSSRRSSGGRRR
jgi:uncharacterized protein DUF3300